MAQDDHPRDERQPAEEGPEQRPSGAEAQPEAASEAAGGKALEDALKTSFLFLKIAIIGLLIYYFGSGLFTVEQSEVSFKQRFGKVVRARGKHVLRPGMHFRWPWEQRIDVSTDEQTLELEDEFWTGGGGEGEGVRQAPSLDMRHDGYLLTGDANIVHMRVRARYRVRDDAEGVIAYKFGVKEPEEVLRRALKAATTEAVGTMHVMSVINRHNLFSSIEQELRRNLREFEEAAGLPLGIEVVAVEAIDTADVKNPSEPGAVSQAFFEAQNAASVRNQLEQEGETEADRIVSDARAQQAELLAEARGYRERLVRSARADAAMLEELLPIYEESQDVKMILLDRFYERAIEEVMSNSPGAFLLHEGGEDMERELRVLLNRQPPPRLKPEQQPGG